MLADGVVFVVIAMIISGACVKLFIDKKRGARCYSCPFGSKDHQNCCQPGCSSCPPVSDDL